jgi:hypothetical protein
MFVILVFTVSAAICAHIFGQAYTYSTASKDLTQAVLIAESTAEEFKAGVGPDSAYTCYYDGDWNPVQEEEKAKSKYEMEVRITEKDALMVCEIALKNSDKSDGGVFYELTAKKALAG